MKKLVIHKIFGTPKDSEEEMVSRSTEKDFDTLKEFWYVMSKSGICQIPESDGLYSSLHFKKMSGYAKKY